jgi:hypothetical protein
MPIEPLQITSQSGKGLKFKIAGFRRAAIQVSGNLAAVFLLDYV